MPIIGTHSSYLWLFCHILVIIKNKKDILGRYQSVPWPNLKKICQTLKRCTSYIPSVSFSGSELHVPVICLAYPCHNCFMLCWMISKWISAGNWIEFRFLYTTALHSSSTTRFICHWCSRCLLCPPSARLPSLGPPRGRPQTQVPPVQGATVTEDHCYEVWGVFALTLQRSSSWGVLAQTLHSLPWRPARPRSTLTAGYVRLGNNQDVCNLCRWDNQFCSLLRWTFEAPCLDKRRQEKIQAWLIHWATSPSRINHNLDVRTIGTSPQLFCQTGSSDDWSFKRHD